MNNRKMKRYYQDFALLCEELNIKPYTDELYEMIAGNPDYFELIFPSGQNAGSSAPERGQVKGSSESVAS